MPIDNPDSIDIISINKERNEVVLTITDHLEWSAPDHAAIFQRKLMSYLNYIYSQRLVRDHPEYSGMTARIEITCMHPPPVEVIATFEGVEKALSAQNIGFGWRHSPFPAYL